MKTIIEIRPDRETRYEMPDQVYDLIEAALQFGYVKTVKVAVTSLPGDLRRQVKVICKPLRGGPLRGQRADILIVDEPVFKQEHQCQFWNEVLEKREPPIFPDHSKEREEESV